MVDFRLAARRDAKAAKAFLNEAIERVRRHRPMSISTDKAHTYRRVIREFNHAAMNRLLGCRQSIRSLRTAKPTLSGIDTIQTIKRGHVHHKKPGIMGELEFIKKLFATAA